MRFLATVLLLSAACLAQSDEARVCVAAPSNLSSLHGSAEAQREQLLDAINAHGRKSKIQVEAVPVRSGDAGAADAREKHCSLLVTFSFDESYGYVPRYDTPLTTPASAQRDTRGTRRISLIYSIDRVDKDQRVDGGEIPLRPAGTDEDAAARSINDLSPRVIHAAQKKH